MNTLTEDLEKLSAYSPLAKQIVESNLTKHCKEVTLIGSDIVEGLNEFSFHPNGKCGCVELNDDYMFGIRCNHLMWCDGECEGVEPFLDNPLGRAILVYGNHKGNLYMKLIYLV